ncbi:MAG: hypothetical protein K2M42_07470 [Oscillospiraceae bacterium]|nr:hypothetical protein [Oscillospiraceae bacterium]
MKRASTLILAALMACLLALPAYAASFYPISVEEYTYGPFDELRIDKVYQLSRSDDPKDIPTEDFDRGGYHYTLLDVVKTDQAETDTKDYTEVVTLETDTKDMALIIQQLELSIDVTTEDGYTGTLTPDYPGITVEAAGYKTSSRTVTATRSYPNLSDADTSLIPRTIQDNGRTLTLADVQWQEAGGFYNATATYSGTASSKYATGYIATVEYKGEVTRTSCDTVIYTATFASHGETHFEDDSQPTQAPAETEAPAAQDSAGMNWAVLVIPAALLLGLAGFGGWKLTKYIKDKKRGYVK